MKNLVKIVILLCLIFSFIGCGEYKPPTFPPPESPEVVNIQKLKEVNQHINSFYSYEFLYTTVIIEDCEYILSTFDRSRTVTHKGNCKNPIHQHNINK